MEPVFAYTDYRKYLHDWYATQRKDHVRITYRRVAVNVGFRSPGHFTMILKGQADISEDLARRFAAFLKLNPEQTRYFLCLVRYNQAPTHEQKKAQFEQLGTFRRSPVTRIESSQYEFYDKWYHSALRVLCEFFPVNQNWSEAGKMLIPPVPARQVQQSIALQVRLGILVKDAQGFWKPADTLLSTGYDTHSLAINNFVQESIRFAQGALDRFGPDDRNLACLTLGLSRDGFEKAREETRAYRRRLLDIAAGDSADRVYQVSVQLFPLSKPCHGSTRP